MKKAQAIWIVAMMTAFVMFGANVALSDAPAAKDQSSVSAETNKSDINKDDHGASVNCPPAGSSSSDQALGNDSPPTLQDSSKSENQGAGNAPCPPGQENRSAQPNDSINQGSTDKGGASSPETPNNNASPENGVK